jgi:DNA-binding FadR family transcriptional regulator
LGDLRRPAQSQKVRLYMLHEQLDSEVLQYIVKERLQTVDGEELNKLPSLGELAAKMRVSRGKLREELIAAQAFGVVEMRPGDGTYVRPFDFYEPIRTMVLYGIAADKRSFDAYYKLRAQIEICFWSEAVCALTEEDHARLYRVLDAAEAKLNANPVEIPHEEHRELHLAMYSRLENPFVLGLIAAYWDAYEAVGLHRYYDLSYFTRMWDWHREMVDAIVAGEFERGKEILIRHFTLLEDRLSGKT